MLRAQTQEPRLVLVDLNPDRSRWFHPVVVYIASAGVRSQGVRDLESDGPHLVRVRPADAILQRPPDRWSEFQRINPSDNARELVRESLFQLRLHPFALLQSLGDDYGLGKEVVRELDVEGKIESDGALAHIVLQRSMSRSPFRRLSSRAAVLWVA